MLDANNYAWHTTADQWMEIGLQNYFVYDGVSDVVVQILANQSTSAAGFHRSTTRPRVYAAGWTGSPPASGTLSSNTGQKLEFSLQMARASTYGDGCVGSSSLAPRLQLAGLPQLGQTVNLDLAQAPANGAVFLVLGFGNGAPFPADLGALGMPGCFQYFTTAARRRPSPRAASAAASRRCASTATISSPSSRRRAGPPSARVPTSGRRSSSG